MRIVLVDPSRAVQRAMRDLIAQGGHEVLSFYEGQKALDCIKVDADVRALITSVQLPDISGLEVCSAARRLIGSRRPLFIIVMSSTEDFGLVVKALTMAPTTSSPSRRWWKNSAPACAPQIA